VLTDLISIIIKLSVFFEVEANIGLIAVQALDASVVI